MNMVNTIFIYFLFMLCHSWHSNTYIRFSRIVKIKRFYMVTIPLTCFNSHCTLVLFYSATYSSAHTEQSVALAHAMDIMKSTIIYLQNISHTFNDLATLIL